MLDTIASSLAGAFDRRAWARVSLCLEQFERAQAQTARHFLLETWALHELRAAIAFQSLGGELHYWRTPAGSEVDFVWTRARRAVGIEVKASTSWRHEFGGALKSLVADRIVQSGFGVYTGAAELKDGPLRVLPWKAFLKELAAGNILG